MSKTIQVNEDVLRTLLDGVKRWADDEDGLPEGLAQPYAELRDALAPFTACPCSTWAREGGEWMGKHHPRCVPA